MIEYENLKELRAIAKEAGIKNTARKSEDTLLEELTALEPEVEVVEEQPKEKTYQELLKDAQQQDKKSRTIKESQMINKLHKKAAARARKRKQMIEVFKSRRTK